MLKAINNNHFYFLRSFLTLKFPDSGLLPKPRVICLDNKNCHPWSCLCEIAAAAQPDVLWGRGGESLAQVRWPLLHTISQDCKRAFSYGDSSPIWGLDELTSSPVQNLRRCLGRQRRTSGQARKCLLSRYPHKQPLQPRRKQVQRA